MKSPPVEDMFAELDSESGDEYILPRKPRSKIYYTRDQLLSLKESPYVKIPEGMSPVSEWYTGPPSDSYPGYRTRSTQLGSEQDSTREGPYTPGKDRRRGQVRTLGEGLEPEDTGRSFGRGLASSGRPRNLARRTDSGTPGRYPVNNEDVDTTPSRFVDRSDKKERSWLRADPKDGLDSETSLMGRFTVKSALKLTTGEDMDRRGARTGESKETREPRANDSGSRRATEPTWRRTTSGHMEKTNTSTTRRFGGHDDEHIPEWMSDEPAVPPDILGNGPPRSAEAQSGMDEIAAYRQAMKDRQERLREGMAQDSGPPLKRPLQPPPGLFSVLTGSDKQGRDAIAAEEKAINASFLLPQAKTKVRLDSAASTPLEPMTPSGKGSRFARFFDPNASPAPTNLEPAQYKSPMPTPPQINDTAFDKAQGLAALLGIKPAALHSNRDIHATPPPTHAIPPSFGMPMPALNPNRPNAGMPETQPPTVDHMARLLGMLKTAQTTQTPQTPPQQSAPAASRSPTSASVSPNSGSRFLAAMLNADKGGGQGSSPQPPSASLVNLPGVTAQQQDGWSIPYGKPNEGHPTGQLDLSSPYPPMHPSGYPTPPMMSPGTPGAPMPMFGHGQPLPPHVNMMSPPPPHTHMQPHPLQQRSSHPEMGPPQQNQFWQLANDLPRGPPPPQLYGQIPPPPTFGAPFPPGHFPPGPPMNRPPIGYTGPAPGGLPPPQIMTPDAMSSNLMAILQNRPQA